MGTISWSPGITVRGLVRRIALGALGLGLLALVSGIVASPGLATFWGGLTSAVVIPAFTLCGVVLGAAYGVSSAWRAELPTLEAALHGVARPLTAQILGAVRLPPEGFSVDEFERLVDETAARLTAPTARGSRRGLRRGIVTLGTRFAVWMVRATLVRRFLSRARARGERVTFEAAQAFLGTQLVDLAFADVRFRTTVAHSVIVGLAAALVLGPPAVRLLLVARSMAGA